MRRRSPIRTAGELEIGQIEGRSRKEAGDEPAAFRPVAFEISQLHLLTWCNMPFPLNNMDAGFARNSDLSEKAP